MLSSASPTTLYYVYITLFFRSFRWLWFGAQFIRAETRFKMLPSGSEKWKASICQNFFSFSKRTIMSASLGYVLFGCLLMWFGWFFSFSHSLRKVRVCVCGWIYAFELLWAYGTLSIRCYIWCDEARDESFFDTHPPSYTHRDEMESGCRAENNAEIKWAQLFAFNGLDSIWLRRRASIHMHVENETETKMFRFGSAKCVRTTAAADACKCVEIEMYYIRASSNIAAYGKCLIDELTFHSCYNYFNRPISCAYIAA